MAKAKFKGYDSRFVPSLEEQAQELNRVRVIAHQARQNAVRLELDSVKAALLVITNYLERAGRRDLNII